MLLNASDEGIVLRSLDYKDGQKIITLFTPTRGVISLIVKGISRKKAHLLTLCSPLTHGEYHFSIGRTDLYTFQDGTPLTTHLNLRSSLEHLQTASRFAEALLSSQFPGKPAPDLFQLLLVYLKALPSFKDPAALKASFLLKLLKHDGHLGLTNRCIQCDLPPSAFAMGESFCRSHAPAYASTLAPEQWAALSTLAESRSLAQLQSLTIDLKLLEKIENIFEEKN